MENCIKTDMILNRTKLICTTCLVLTLSACSLNPHQGTGVNNTTSQDNHQSQNLTSSIETEHEPAAPANEIYTADDADNTSLIETLTQKTEPIYLEDHQEIIVETSTSDTTPDAITTVETSQAEEQNLWNRIRAGYALNDQAKKHSKVAIHERWYTKHPKYIERTFERARPFLFEIVEQLEDNNIPLEVALLPVVESAFQPFAYSHGRAAGIWQFIPGTAKQYGLKIDWWYDERRDVMASTKAAVTYLSYLNKRFKGDWLLALAAYNSGEGTVERAIRKNKRKNKPTDFWNLSLPKETRGYVPRLLAISNIVENPEHFDVHLNPIANITYIGQVDSGSQIDIALAAELADMTIDEIYNLNPAINRWTTPPNGPHTFFLPTDKVTTFNENLAKLPQEKRVTWARHKVKSGETLSHIAKRYRTTTSVLAQVNNLKGSLIRANQHLIIPVAQRSANSYRLSADQRLSKTKNTPRKGRSKITHTVRKGDTFWDIARKYKVGVTSLSSWNGMAPKDTLRIGQKLVIWQKQASSSYTTLRTAKTAKTQRIVYTVRRGDSLSRIAASFNVSVAKIEQWNNKLKSQKYLKPGQVLTLFVDITRTAETG